MQILSDLKIHHIKNSKPDSSSDFASDVLAGLSKKHKSLSSKYFYNKRGSELFQKIMELEEYYPTRCEFQILEDNKEILAKYLTDKDFNLIELGSGDGKKTKILLKHFLQRRIKFQYFPLDISINALEDLLSELKSELPALNATGFWGEYFEGLRKLGELNEKPNFVLFLGSNIGNFDPLHTDRFLKRLRESLNHDDIVLIGFDLVKDERILHSAYSDSKGVTAEFNLNLLSRINEELEGNFDLSKFRHYALYDPEVQVMKSFLISLADHEVKVGKLKRKFHFKYMESIFTENSYKYSLEKIAKMAKRSGFEIVDCFEDEKKYFADALLKCVK